LLPNPWEKKERKNIIFVSFKKNPNEPLAWLREMGKEVG
jgi:hypothetical protein